MNSTDSHTFFATKKVMLEKKKIYENKTIKKINPDTKVPAQMCLQKKLITDSTKKFLWK